MKINITINDLNQKQAAELISLFSGFNKEEAVLTAQVQAPVLPQVSVAPVVMTPTPVVAPVAVVEAEDDTASAADMTGQVDAQGLPWDERIHSSNKKMISDGTWKKRRGVQEMETTRVEAELRAKLQTHFAAGGNMLYQLPAAVPAAPVEVAPHVTPVAPQPMPVVQPVTTPQVAADAYAMFGNVTLPQQVAPVSAPVAPIPAPMPPVAPVAPVVAPMVPTLSAVGRDFQSILTRVQRGCASGVINLDFINTQIIAALNLAYNTNMSSLTDVSHRADLVEQTHLILDKNNL